MTSDKETVSRQTPWAGNIAKTMTSNGKQFAVTREMLTAVARDQSVQLKVTWCCRKNLTACFRICFSFVLLYNKALNDWSLGKQWILFPSNLNVSLNFVSGNKEILGKQNSLFPSGPVIKCLLSNFLFLDHFITAKQCTNHCRNNILTPSFNGLLSSIHDSVHHTVSRIANTHQLNKTFFWMEKEYKGMIVVSKRSHRYDSWSPYCGKRSFSQLWKCISYLVLNISLLCSYCVPWWVSSGVWSLFLKSGFKQKLS